MEGTHGDGRMVRKCRHGERGRVLRWAEKRFSFMLEGGYPSGQSRPKS